MSVIEKSNITRISTAMPCAGAFDHAQLASDCEAHGYGRGHDQLPATDRMTVTRLGLTRANNLHR
jgi:hypothetical protein